MIATAGRGVSFQPVERGQFSTVVDTFPKDAEQAVEMIRRFETEPPRGNTTSPGHIWLGQHTFRPQEPVLHFQANLDAVRQAAINADANSLRPHLLRLYTLRLDGRTRFALSDPKPSGDLQLPAQNHLWALFKDDAARQKVRLLTEEAFALHFVVDPTGMQEFRIRLSERAPVDSAEEQALDARSREFHSNARLVSDLSDGVQAYTGLLSAVMSLPHRVLLIDEPEAFLHPVLARRLGAALATTATERTGTLVVATHSADFLMGCMEAAQETTIVRLTYEGATASARSLDSNEIRSLMLDPLLRSTGALRGLFHRAVLVAEADADRAFYDEINRRLQEVGRGAPDALVINAQNWQTIPRVIGPLRKIGIPAAALVDLDAIVVDDEWPKYYEVAALAPSEIERVEELRKQSSADLATVGSKTFKEEGVATLGKEEASRINALIREMANIGVFLVPVGELEGWLAGLGIPRKKKRDWIVEILSALGSDPDDPDYIHPADNDVWSFMDAIGAWTSEPSRRGLP